MSHKRHFSRFLSADPDRVHFAAHSHHFWPDVTLGAHERAWLDAAQLADRKWDKIFSQVVPAAQAHVARLLKLPDPSSVAFAPNTHDFLVRLLSSLPIGRPHKILTSDGEFHSLSRQLARLEEDDLARVVRVPCQPFDTFAARWTEAAASDDFDLAYVSQVFFDSGFANANLTEIVSAFPNRNTMIVVDGYHGFCALPTDLGAISDRVFYLAGGYKYAMSGEGACFVHAPDGWAMRPTITGWFAAFGALEDRQIGKVPYGPGGARLMGATFDPSALYRFVAAMDLLVREAISVEHIHGHVHSLQGQFVEALRGASTGLGEAALLVPISEPRRGHFLTYRLAHAAEIHRKLLEHGVVTDVRGDRLRFGFGLYHDTSDIKVGVERIVRALS